MHGHTSILNTTELQTVTTVKFMLYAPYHIFLTFAKKKKISCFMLSTENEKQMSWPQEVTVSEEMR